MNCKSNNFDVNLVLNPIELNCLDMKFSKLVDLKYKESEFFLDFRSMKLGLKLKNIQNLL